MSSPLNKTSRNITQPKSQGASQAMLYATGMSEEDMNKAQVGIASVWYEGNPCNMHLLDLAAAVKEGVVAAGLVGMRFNSIGVSDGISMGTEGMSYSLQSRDLIADSIETVMMAQWYDANISLPGCDKNMPGCLMAMGRVNRPALMVYGGTIRAGRSAGGEKIEPHRTERFLERLQGAYAEAAELLRKKKRTELLELDGDLLEPEEAALPDVDHVVGRIRMQEAPVEHRDLGLGHLAEAPVHVSDAGRQAGLRARLPRRRTEGYRGHAIIWAMPVSWPCRAPCGSVAVSGDHPL